MFKMGFPNNSADKDSACNAGNRKLEFDPWVGKMPWRRKWQPTPMLLPEIFHGQQSLVGYIQSMGLQIQTQLNMSKSTNNYYDDDP